LAPTDKANWQSAIRKIGRPTRYRVVVLTSSRPLDGKGQHQNWTGTHRL